MLLNSILFFSYFFLLKEESTGRYINVRFYDLYQMKLFPNEGQITKLVNIFNKYKDIEFPSIVEQFDKNFNERYNDFWENESGNTQVKLWNILDQIVDPSVIRLNLDMDVCNALGVKVSKDELKLLYSIFIQEMILVKHLKRD